MIDRGAGVPDPAPLDVLEFGSPTEPGPRRWVNLVLIGVAVLALLAAAALTRSWLASTDPTFSTEEIIALYQPPPQTAVPVAWDEGSLQVSPGDPDRNADVETEPEECLPVVTAFASSAPGSSDWAGMTFDRARNALGARSVAGGAVTYRYPDAAEARRRFDEVRVAAGRCASFTIAADIALRLEQFEPGAETRARSDLSFLLRADSAGLGPTLLHLVRYGNTLTWLNYADTGRGTTTDPGGPLADAIAARLQSMR